MPVFSYSARPAQGNGAIQQGEVDLSTKDEVLAYLHKQKLIPVSVREKPKDITLKFGTGLEVGYFGQLRRELDLEKSVAYNVGEGRTYIKLNGKDRHVVGYLKGFLFSPKRSMMPVTSGCSTSGAMVGHLRRSLRVTLPTRRSSSSAWCSRASCGTRTATRARRVSCSA